MRAHVVALCLPLFLAAAAQGQDAPVPQCLENPPQFPFCCVDEPPRESGGSGVGYPLTPAQMADRLDERCTECSGHPCFVDGEAREEAR